MSEGWQRYRLSEAESETHKPGQRWELSQELDIEPFNFNVAVLESGERLSENHFHYHENQEELIHIIEGRSRIEVLDDRFIAGQGETVRFAAGKTGTHLVHNPFSEECRLVAIGWPPEGRYPVKQVKTREELLAERE